MILIGEIRVSLGAYLIQQASELATQRVGQEIDGFFCLHCEAQVLFGGTDLVAAFTHYETILFQQLISKFSAWYVWW